ncbi:MAG TPA: RNA polymerase sigma factor SigB [Bacillales bacterium]|nr:RNA polymerase sigma factor SigB [Bacillales bacterium]
MATQSQPPHQNNDVYKWIAAFQEGADSDVQMKIVDQYKNLVELLAFRYSRGRGLHEDIVQVGMIGLLAAIRRYDLAYGKSFESFAIPTIVGEIKRFIRDKTWSVHVPRRIKELGPRIKKAVDILTNEYQRSPKVAEIADYLEVSEEEVLETMEISSSYHALSIDSQIDTDAEGSQVTIIDMIASREDGYNEIDRTMLIEKAFVVLNEREREILNYTFYQNMSQKETGEKVGISQMHVSRIQRRALKKLKEALQVDTLEL